jgi:hypothetical protein
VADNIIHNVIGIIRLPLIGELDIGLSPVLLSELFRREPFCFFLDSGRTITATGLKEL